MRERKAQGMSVNIIIIAAIALIILVILVALVLTWGSNISDGAYSCEALQGAVCVDDWDDTGCPSGYVENRLRTCPENDFGEQEICCMSQ